MKLTNTKVNTLPIPAGKSQQMHWDSETRGFGVRVTSSGGKSWVVLSNSARRLMGLDSIEIY